jgi:hypothetical protein
MNSLWFHLRPREPINSPPFTFQWSLISNACMHAVCFSPVPGTAFNFSSHAWPFQEAENREVFSTNCFLFLPSTTWNLSLWPWIGNDEELVPGMFSALSSGPLLSWESQAQAFSHHCSPQPTGSLEPEFLIAFVLEGLTVFVSDLTFLKQEPRPASHWRLHLYPITDCVQSDGMESTGLSFLLFLIFSTYNGLIRMLRNIYMCVCILSSIHLSACLPACLSIHLSIYPSIHPSFPRSRELLTLGSSSSIFPFAPAVSASFKWCKPDHTVSCSESSNGSSLLIPAQISSLPAWAIELRLASSTTMCTNFLR